jgi:hypothetical protein
MIFSRDVLQWVWPDKDRGKRARKGPGLFPDFLQARLSSIFTSTLNRTGQAIWLVRRDGWERIQPSLRD